MSSTPTPPARQRYFVLFGFSLGMLVGGATLAYLGSLTGNELATCAMSVAGMIGGSYLCGYLVKRRLGEIPQT